MYKIKNILIIPFLVVLIVFLSFNLCYGIDENQLNGGSTLNDFLNDPNTNSNQNNIDDSGLSSESPSGNLSDEQTSDDDFTSSSSNSSNTADVTTTSTQEAPSTTVSSVSKSSNSSTITNILNIALIVIGILLVLLAIAILLRLN